MKSVCENLSLNFLTSVDYYWPWKSVCENLSLHFLTSVDYYWPWKLHQKIWKITKNIRDSDRVNLLPGISFTIVESQGEFSMAAPMNKFQMSKLMISGISKECRIISCIADL